MALQIKIEATGLSKIDEAVEKLNSSFKELKNTLKNIESDGINQLTKTLPKTADNMLKMDRQSRKVNNSYYQMGQRMQETGRRMDYLGSKMLPISIALGGLVAGAIKSGIAFESSFAGITKTINMSAYETQQLRGKMIELSKTIPVSVNELNKIGELGGQLGIGSKDIVTFTDTIAKLGVATNLTSEEGSLMLAQFMNVMKLDDSQIATLGSTIVELGNNFATTEKDITSMASRLSATTSVMGISSADTLGFATAMSSLGISAEEGGSALGRVLIKFNDFATQGGKATAKLGKVAGMTGEAFSNMWKEDKTKAMQKVIQGLGEMADKGKDILPVVEELGIKNTRDRTTILKLASGYRTLNGALKASNNEWGSTDALSKEAGNRFATLESQIELLKNNVVALAIKMYDELRPTLVKVVKNVNNFVNSLKDINPKVLTGLVGFMGLIATIGPALKMINIPMQLFGGLLKKVGVEGTTATGIFKGMNPQMFSFGKAIKDGAKTSGGFATKLKAIGSNVLGLVNPMTLAVTGLALLAGGIYTVYKKSSEEQKRLNALGEESKAKYENIMAGYTDTTKSNIDEMTTAFVDFGTNLQLAGTGTDYFNLTDLTKNFQSSLDRMKTAYNTTMQGIIKAKTEGVTTSKYLSEQEKNDYIKSVSEQYSGHEKEASVIFAKIQKVYDNASKNGRDLSEKDLKKIQGFYDDLQTKVKGLDLTPPTEADNLLKQMSLGRKLTDEQKKLVESSISDTYWEQLTQLQTTNKQGTLSDKKYNSDKMKLLEDTRKQTAQLYGENVDDLKIMNGKIFTDTEGSYKKTSKFLKGMGVDLALVPDTFVDAWGKSADKASKLYLEGMDKGLTGPKLSQYVNRGMDLLQTNLSGKWSSVGEEATRLYQEGARKGLMGNKLVKYVDTELSKIPTATAETSKANGQAAIRQYTEGMTLGDALGGIGTWFNNMWSGLTVNGPLLMAKAGEVLGNFWQGIVNFDLLGKINTFITNTIINMALPVLNARKKGTQLVSNMWKAFTDFNLLGKINTWISNTIVRITLPLVQMWGKGTKIVSKMWQGFTDYNLLGKINTWISNTIARITLPLVQMWNKGKKTVSTMWQGFKDYDLLGNINNWLGKKLSNISIPSFDLFQIGKDITGGIAKGITNFDLKASIDGLLGKIPGWAQKLLEIRSPSKVMAAQVGHWIPAGVAQGITQNMGTLKDTSQQLATKTEAYMKSSFNNMQLDDLNNALNIQPHLSDTDKQNLKQYYRDLISEIETQQLIIDTKFNKDVSTNLQSNKQAGSLANQGATNDHSVKVDTVNITTNKLDRKELELELKKLSKESGK